mmetsp:Transcript_107426/g.342288  ORF Transcript_107426/g.342288 Transcript_107426/m.342288 type:complete len:293 (+) Transcript_107426:342-1220(+)
MAAATAESVQAAAAATERPWGGVGTVQSAGPTRGSAAGPGPAACGAADGVSTDTGPAAGGVCAFVPATGSSLSSASITSMYASKGSTPSPASGARRPQVMVTASARPSPSSSSSNAPTEAGGDAAASSAWWSNARPRSRQKRCTPRRCESRSTRRAAPRCAQAEALPSEAGASMAESAPSPASGGSGRFRTGQSRWRSKPQARSRHSQARSASTTRADSLARPAGFICGASSTRSAREAAPRNSRSRSSSATELLCHHRLPVDGLVPARSASQSSRASSAEPPEASAAQSAS